MNVQHYLLQQIVMRELALQMPYFEMSSHQHRLLKKIKKKKKKDN